MLEIHLLEITHAEALRRGGWRVITLLRDPTILFIMNFNKKAGKKRLIYKSLIALCVFVPLREVFSRW